MAIKGKKIDGFIADMKVFKDRILPKAFVSFQKYIALELYKRIMQKTPVDKGTLRGSWTISIGSQDTTPANKTTTAKQGQGLTASEKGVLDAALAQMAEAKLGQIIWINNAMPYVLRIEFDGHSSVKAPAGMVQISINEMRSFLATKKSEFVALRQQGAT
jgi:hypothetical protein